MDKKIAGLLGGVAALTTLGAAQAATPSDVNATDAVRVSSYSDLLTPVPNAMAALQADDAAKERQAKDTRVAQLVVVDHHHHHHHHHHYRRHRHHHHHHHHHHSGVGITIGVGH